ncbi:MAG: ABC transporter ATP-binding protein [Alphaproteobacteria bacterium]|nr:ABC transporter ATP-binding protein [Alphaproteobacteria bacterium]
MSSPDAGADAAPAIELVGIDKRFGAVHANKAISLAVPKGTIHGIVGENGAGKSTLMSILYGYYQADAGEIRVDGRRIVVRSPSEAIAAGIGMVHQHFMLVDDMTVLENLILGVEGDWRLGPGLAKARAAIGRLATDYGLEVDPDAVVGDLPVGLQQRVEILKALYRGAEILVLDEPTAVLTPQEADQLFRILRALKREGKTIVLITHKLREILDVTDDVSVMRQGAMVATLPTREATREQLAELMVGRKVLLRVDKAAAAPGEVVLQVDDLRVRDRAGHERVKGVSFEVRRGEIVGIAGVSGNGQSEVLEALAGTTPIAAGRIVFKGRDITDDPARTAKGLRELGLGHVPEDRHRQGLVTAFEANESAILGHHDDRRYNAGAFMRRGAVVGDCDRLMGDFDVRPRAPRLTTALFSGGNQQKIVLAREMDRAPDLLLVGQPTRGVDIGAIEYIHRRLVEMRDRGAGVLLVSVELDEILALADRVMVMFDGRIVGQRPIAAADERTIGLMMAGAEAA